MTCPAQEAFDRVRRGERVTEPIRDPKAEHGQRFVKPFTDAFSGARILILQSSDEIVQRASSRPDIGAAVAENRRFTNAQFIVGDVLREPHLVEHGAFDAALLIRFLTCFPNEGERNRLLATAGAALKRHGLLYVRDFLLSAGYRARYDAAARNGLPYGNFPVRDAEGAVQFVAHHHTESEARGMLSAYEPLLFDSQESLSMNGNPCTLV